MASGPGPTTPPSPQQGMTEGICRNLSMHRHSEGGDGDSPKHSALARLKYGLLAPEDAAEPQERGYGHEATMGTGGPNMRDTETGNQNRQHALLAWGQPKDADEERIPPERQRTLISYGYQRGKGGYPSSSSARFLCAARGSREAPQPGRALLQRAATRGRRRGDPPQVNARLPCAARG